MSSLQKVVATIRMLAYGVRGDFADEYVYTGESTTIESLKRFIIPVVVVFGDQYLRSPNTRRHCSVAKDWGTMWFSGDVRKY